MHKLLADVPLLPRIVSFFCPDCRYADGLYSQRNIAANATVWLVSEEGRAIAKVCHRHAKEAIAQLAPLGWSVAPVFHDEPGNQWITRKV